ncbi:DNA invertase Pin-like site-specific DNA recombinase [Chryseobacterium vietnamense]|uniref:DNA invertase Pin-like site-specific DNA recombinase n=1 Tax=Chryseobacterium vietnamense TaxID=866785 RepID=A0ACC6J8E3_9FLAO|nr:recombinase family protein [Chryseobacterium vietnamense]MDR6459266.1 DNA invertase Pin-like site-specific DNA recombinase [Chryseobacterium vietnamense]
MFNIVQQTYKKGVAYYRHSAEDKQENSVTIQRGHVERFALEHNITIIHEEVDEGVSGLLANRPGFERLFDNWIKNVNAPNFDYVLVYDVSRWGRFQDQDQAGHYVYLCKKHGKEVVYVSRGFVDANNQLFSSLEISIQRYMAAEYSRQLSEKVFYGCVKVSQQGYSAGGMAVYGMARQLLDVNKKPIRILSTGEHKQIANERVSFTPKNDETTETVKKIFDLFVNERLTIPEIASYFNQRKIFSTNRKQWNKSKIIKILTDETYIGTRIYNKTWGRLKQKSYRNPRSEWVVVPDAFESTIDKDIFKNAQERIYWMFPSNWRKGINVIKKARKNIYNDIRKWLLNKGATEFEAEELISELPIVFSVKPESKINLFWCFLISEKMRNFENVLGISVLSNSKKIINEFFIFSTKDFTSTNFLILSENSPLYYKTKIETQNLEEAVKELITEFKKSKKWYKHKYTFVDNF